MEHTGVKYTFTAEVYYHSVSADMKGWTMVSLPEELSGEIKANFKGLESGWGRLKVTARVGNSEWQPSIWFDTKQNTYLLPLKAAVRKKEKIELDGTVEVTIWI